MELLQWMVLFYGFAYSVTKMRNYVFAHPSFIYRLIAVVAITIAAIGMMRLH